ncbi:MAG: hypothetical protein ACI9LM_003065 [Alteromonadaceae bacterium]|jgi:hypothetical protein
MDVDTYEKTELNSNFNADITRFEIANVTANKKALSKIARQKYLIKEKLDFLSEKRFLDGQLNSLSDYWDI